MASHVTSAEVNAPLKGLSAAPLNPVFEQWLERKASGVEEESYSAEAPLGYIPPPIQIPAVKTPLSLRAALPATFDLRTSTPNGVTPVKDQGGCGSCWAFGVYGSLESYIKYKLGSVTWDFSEQDMNQYHGFDWRECEGGNHFLSTAYMARWNGPVNENEVPYPYVAAAAAEETEALYDEGSGFDVDTALNSEMVAEEEADQAQNLGSAPGAIVRKHIQNVYFLPNRASYTDNNRIKNALVSYGAVTISFQWNASYYNPTTAAYYAPITGGNHMVAIVGWNDYYPKSNFKVGSQPPANGAFIVKNSWGTSWGKSGYFYMSYYDKSLIPAASFYNVEATSNFTRAYEYDPLGWTRSLGYGATTAWFANIFKAASNAYKIKAVSFYTPVPASTYTVYVYKNVANGQPRNGTLVATKSGTIPNPGYNTVRFTTPLAVTPLARFSVVVKLTTPGYNYPIPMEERIAGYSTAASAYTGQSFISTNGTGWSDMTTAWNKNANVALKAFGGL